MWISWDGHRGCQLGPSFATTASSMAHYKFTVWTPATPGWTEPAKPFQNTPAEGKGLFSLQERLSKATDICHWPEAVRCSIRLCWGRWHLPWGPSGSISLTAWPLLSCSAWRPRKVKFTLKLRHSQWHPRNGRWTQNSLVKNLTYFRFKGKTYFKNSVIFF